MIPVNDIIPGNIYSQDDASFLLGEGFTKAAEFLKPIILREKPSAMTWA